MSEGVAVRRAGTTLPRELRLFLALSFALNAVCLVCEAVCRYALHKPWPYNFPLLKERAVPDLTNFYGCFRGLHSAAFFTSGPIPFMYPAPVAPIYGFFFSFPHFKIVYFASLVGVFVGLAIGLYSAMQAARPDRRSNGLFVIATFVLSYPIAFELKQGNMEVFVFVLTAAAVWFLARDNDHAAAALIGVAGAMKLFPFIYLGIFLARKKLLPVLTGLSTAIVVTLASLRYITPSLRTSWRGIGEGLAYYQKSIALFPLRETCFDHSLFAVVKTALHYRTHPPTQVQAERMLHLVLAASAVAGVVVFVARIRKLPLTNQVLSLCVASILFTPVSFDYTLIHLYVPFAILAVALLRAPVRGAAVVMVCLAICMSLETEVIRQGVSYSGQVKALVLLALFVLSVWRPLKPGSDTYARVPEAPAT